MVTRLVAVIGATLVTGAVIATGGSRASAGLDVSGTWDAHYSITCNAAFDQAATELSATVDCGPGAAGTLAGHLESQLRVHRQAIEARARDGRHSLEDAEAELLEHVSMRTWIAPGEVADMVLFLASPQARHVTGQAIGVDGNLEWEA